VIYYKNLRLGISNQFSLLLLRVDEQYDLVNSKLQVSVLEDVKSCLGKSF